MLIHLDHVGIVAATIGDAQQVLVEQMGMELDVSRSPLPDGTYFAPERTNNYFFNVAEGQTQIEVLIPADTTSGTAKFLARRGPGLHHLGYAVANVGEEADRLAREEEERLRAEEEERQRLEEEERERAGTSS